MSPDPAVSATEEARLGPGAVTPGSWRVLALLTLVGGTWVGDQIAGQRGRLIPSAAALVMAVAVLPVARASRRPPIPPRAGPLDALAPPPTFSVVVAARDEATVLPQLVADLGHQDWRGPDGDPRFELVVVDDRSTDGSGELVQRAAEAAGIAAVTTVVRRDGDDLPDGKGAALTAAQPERCRGDYVVVLDADARVEPGFLRALAAYVAAGAPAVTPRRGILVDRAPSGLAGLLIGAQADEQTLDGEIQRGRWGLGGCSEFRGNGITIRRDLLAALGGWRASALTEDLDLSSRLAAEAGINVAWALDCEVWEEPVGSWAGLLRQRLRWAEGAFRRLFEHGPAVLASPRLAVRAKADFVVYAGQLLAPPVVLGAVLGGVGRRRPAPALILIGAYLASVAALAWDALRWDALRWEAGRPADSGATRMLPAERLGRAVRSGLFTAVWLVAVPGALWRLATGRGQLHYEKMAHGLGTAGRSTGPTLG